MIGHIILTSLTMFVTSVMDLTFGNMVNLREISHLVANNSEDYIKAVNCQQMSWNALNKEYDDNIHFQLLSARSGNIHLMSWNTIKEHSPGPPWTLEQALFNL